MIHTRREFGVRNSKFGIRNCHPSFPEVKRVVGDSFRIPNSQFRILTFGLRIAEPESQRAVIRDIPERPVLLARAGNELGALPACAVQPGLERHGDRADSESADKDMIEQRRLLDTVTPTPTLPVRGAAERVVKPFESDTSEDRVNGLQLALAIAAGRTGGVEVAEHDHVWIADLVDPPLDPGGQRPVLAPAFPEVVRSRFEVNHNQGEVDAIDAAAAKVAGKGGTSR